jgi:small subunit ribosomal protein S6
LTDYEILLLLDPDLEEDRQSEIVSRIRETAERGGGAWERQDAWGRRKLAYEIRHKGEGTYHLLLFRCEPEVLDEISRVLRITDGVLRHLAVRRPRATSTQTAAAAPAPAAEAPAPAAEAPAAASAAAAPEAENVQEAE